MIKKPVPVVTGGKPAVPTEMAPEFKQEDVVFSNIFNLIVSVAGGDVADPAENKVEQKYHRKNDSGLGKRKEAAFGAGYGRYLVTWLELNAFIGDCSEKDALALLSTELSNKARKIFLLRIYSRYNYLRAHRERRELCKRVKTEAGRER